MLVTKRQTIARLVMCAVIAGLALLGCAAFSKAGADRGEMALTAYNSSNLVRLHVRASSEDPLAHRVKLAVKDEVLSCTAELAAGAPDLPSAAKAIEDGLPVIASRAQAAVGRAGASHQVEARLGVERFAESTWNGRVLPAGEDTTLTVSIGNGTGSNWWCVLFPPLYPIDIANSRLIEIADDAKPSRGLALFELPAWAARLLGLPSLYFAQAKK